MNHVLKLFYAIKNGEPLPKKLDLSSLDRLLTEYQASDLPFNINSTEDFLQFLNNQVDALKGIVKLKLRSNQLKLIPDFVFHLGNLQELDLSRNDLDEIPKQIALLEELKYLDVSDNHITQLPDILLELRELRGLTFYRNRVTELPKNIHKASNLRRLIGFNNQINSIPENILKLKKLNDLKLHDNPIGNVSAAIYTQGNGIDALRIYFQSLKEKSSYFYESKIIVLGDGEVGKTTLVKNLKEICSRETHSSTVGLEVSDWLSVSANNPNGFRFNIWDFGGQGKYRTVQQLFCTPNSIYIYVTVPEQLSQPEKYGSYQYWLNFVSVLGDNSPTIFVINKVDQSDENTVFINEAEIKKSFPFVKGFLKTSFNRFRSSSESIQQLKDLIETCIPPEESKIETTEPGQLKIGKLKIEWQKVIERISSMRSKYSYISKDTFYEICGTEKISNLKEVEVLLEFMNKSGRLLTYPGRQTKISNFEIILNINWVKQAVYKIVGYLIEKGRSWFVEKDLHEVWDDFKLKKEYYLEITDLMLDINFSFQIDARNYIPSLLPTFPMDKTGIDVQPIYTFECHFSPYIPAGLLHKLIASNLARIDMKMKLWENRVVFKQKDNSKIEVVEDWVNGKLLFHVASKRLDIVKKYSKKITKAIKEFEGRNYISEIYRTENIIYERNTIALEHAAKYDFVDELNRVTIIKQEIKQVNIGIHEGAVNINSMTDLNTGLISFPLSQYKNLKFNRFTFENEVHFTKIWNGKNRTFLSTPTLVNDALLFFEDGWYHTFYQKNRTDAITTLINKLPSDAKKIKIVALPEELWAFVKNKWPDLHFNDHFVYEFPIQKLSETLAIGSLKLTDIDVVLQHQKYINEYGGRSYLAHLIKNGIAVGYRLEGKLVSWAVMHDDGSMGFLRVLEPYRKNGIASQVSAHLINRIIERNKKAIAHIGLNNLASKTLAKKLGGQQTGKVSWVRLRSKEEIKRVEKGLF